MLALAGDTAEIVLVVLLPSACALDPEQGNVTGVLAAAACVGQMFGAALFASSADAFGRRQVFIACGAIVAIAGLASAWAQGIARLALLRGIVGIGVGGGAALSAVLMVEFLPEESRGKILLQTRALSSFGGIYVTLAAWLVLASRGWRLLAAIVALPAIVSVVIARNLLPESPRWLQRRGRAAEAAAVVARVAEDNGVDLPPGALKLCEPERQWVSWRARRRVEEMRHQQLLEDHVPQDRHHLLDEFDTESVASSASSDQDDDDEGHDLEDLRCLCCCCRSTEHSEAALERSDVDISCDDCYAEYGDGYRRNETGHYDAGFFGSEANPSTTLPAYGAAKGTFASAFERINPILRRRKYTDSSSCRRCLQRKPFRNDGAALARALRSPDGSYRHPRIAIWIGTLGRRSWSLWIHSFLLGGAYVATATLSSLLFAQATHENARHLLSGTTASSTDECKSAIDYGGLTAGSFAEIMTTALVSLVVDLGRKRVIFVLLVVAAFQLFVLSSVTLGALFTTVVSLTARAALFAANAVAWA